MSEGLASSRCRTLFALQKGLQSWNKKVEEDAGAGRHMRRALEDGMDFIVFRER